MTTYNFQVRVMLTPFIIIIAVGSTEKRLKHLTN